MDRWKTRIPVDGVGTPLETVIAAEWPLKDGSVNMVTYDPWDPTERGFDGAI